MKTTGIVVKMTIVTFIFFMLFIGAAFLFEGTFFESFYLEKKIDLISKSIDGFAYDYSNSNWESQDLKDNISLFNNENGVELTVLDKHGNIKNEEVYEIIIRSENDTVYRLHLNHALNENSNSILSLKQGDSLEVYGFKWQGSKEIFKPLMIKRDNVKIISAIDDDEKKNYQYLRGTIIGKRVPEYSDIKSAFYKQPIREIVLDVMKTYGSKYQYIYQPGVYEKSKEGDLYNQMIFYHPLGSSLNREIVFALESQRHIIEAKSILSDYHTYILIFSFILIIFLSYFYSVTLLKPLLNVNKIASRMAKLDFSEKIEISRKDEIGSLAKSLNTLSTNLSTNMDQLKDANKQLTIEIKKERKLESLRKEFVSGVSHELKTPLGIIRGFAEGIKDDVFDDTTYYLDVIIEETEKMDALVVDMLELSKLESTNFEITKQIFNLFKLTEFVINKFEYSLKEKGLSVDFIRNTKFSDCYGDEVRIEQVIVNFMSNAIRHSTRNTSITITASAENEELLFSIENRGDNIPESKLTKVWNRFYRVEESRNKSDGGTGLGLAIVKNIMDLHGSRFGVKNTSEGVMFYFTINQNNN